MTIIVNIKDCTGRHRNTSIQYYPLVYLLRSESYDPTYAGFTNLHEKIDQVFVYRQDDDSYAHWQVVLRTETSNFIKVDMNKGEYRLIYGADSTLPMGWSLEQLTPPRFRRTFCDVFTVLVHLADDYGCWKEAKYTCQTFIVGFLQRFSISSAQRFRYELADFVNRACPPDTTEYSDYHLQQFGMKVLIHSN
ncbi:MAG: hypothetical protein KAH18_01375 [Psychromonas sp.]|nr:hypothetical protein [Psychromonas sp.]